VTLVHESCSDAKKIIIEDQLQSFSCKFENRFLSIPWSELRLEYFLTSDCVADIDSSAPKLDCELFEERNLNTRRLEPFHSDDRIITVNIHCQNLYSTMSKKRWINFRWYFRNGRIWEEVGDPIAREQVELCLEKENDEDETSLFSSDSIRVQETESSVELWILKAEDKYMRKTAVIDKTTGGIISLCNQAGVEMLSKPIQPNFTRASTDNDRGGIDRVKGKVLPLLGMRSNSRCWYDICCSHVSLPFPKYIRLDASMGCIQNQVGGACIFQL